ncbi:MAG: GCN5-related N-acetyltransferase [Gemmatimonadetes bacterium]|nr:GCN5-related N-acetyltransferase [Gemmatimonadota bacterium]
MTGSAVRIRAARPEERSLIAALTGRAYAEYAALMESSAWKALHGAVDASLADEADVTRIVAELDGVIVGSAALYAPGAEAYGRLTSRSTWPELRLVAVDPPARGRGIARLVVMECARRAQESGASVLGLHTSRSMRMAKQLYERMGFIRDPEHDFHPPGAEPVEGYRLVLTDPAPLSEL